MLSVINAECQNVAFYALCHYAERRYPGCFYPECYYAVCHGTLTWASSIFNKLLLSVQTS